MMLDPVSDVPAPPGAVAWSVSTGWIVDLDDLTAAEGRDLVLTVDDDGVARDIAGEASIASLMWLDVRLLSLRREIDSLREGLLDVGEALVAALAGRPRGEPGGDPDARGVAGDS